MYAVELDGQKFKELFPKQIKLSCFFRIHNNPFHECSKQIGHKKM